MTITIMSPINKSIVKTKYPISTPSFFHEQAPRIKITIVYTPIIKLAINN